MAKIKHIAIKVEDQEKAATFYKETFGMTEAWRGPVRDDGKRAIYLTDGYINMAVLPARGGREGIDHFGFQVEDMETTLKTAGQRVRKATRQRSLATAVSLKWGFMIPRGNLSMFRCMAGRRRAEFTLLNRCVKFSGILLSSLCGRGDKADSCGNRRYTQ